MRLKKVIMGDRMNQDLKIIKKYADKHFRCKNDFHYDIIIMKDGTVSIKYEKNKERKK